MIRKYIFVAGGVMSGVGKGVAASSIARILKDSGYHVTAFKIDPYVNVDAGTMNPTEHGEVFVLNDGSECDQDMGNYERFLEEDLSGGNYMTTGSVYLSVIQKERNLGYEGKCVEVVPHVPLAVIVKIQIALHRTHADIGVIEIGGTIGEYQNIVFLEAVRMLQQQHPNDVTLVLVSYLPLLNKDNELKTKPTQYAVRTLNSAGLQPDFILARSAHPIDLKRKQKIAFNCNMSEESIVAAPDVGSIYDIPLNFKRAHLDTLLLRKLHIRRRTDTSDPWKQFISRTAHTTSTVRIGIVGKYFSSGAFMLADSYLSVIEALRHAGFAQRSAVAFDWIDAGAFDPSETSHADVSKNLERLRGYDGIVVPGGFGARGIEGKIEAIAYARREGIPFLGLCYGMQLAVVEYARHVVGLVGAHTVEVDAHTPYPVVDVMPDQKELIARNRLGGTMRLGAFPACIQKGTIAYHAYVHAPRFAQATREKKSSLSSPAQDLVISERHRHRYEINPDYHQALRDAGLIISGISPSGKLAEIIELPPSVHPFFVGTQFHPELRSWPLDPHPLFKKFIAAAHARRQLSA